MDLLCDLQSSSDSENEVNSVKECSADNSKNKRQNPSTSPTDANCTDKRKKRKESSSVSIISASKAPPDLFVRAIPHRRGHWSGHILIPISWTSSCPSVSRSIRVFQNGLEDMGYSAGVIVQHDDLHLSLSKPFSLQLGQIDSFVDQLSRRLENVPSTVLYVDNTNGEILVNDEKTRSFWGWRVHPNEILRRLVGHIDAVLANYNQPTYYDPPIFHISLASCAGQVEGLKTHECYNSDQDDDDETETVDVNRIKCNFGAKKSYDIALQQQE